MPDTSHPSDPTGVALLYDPLLNRSTAFSAEERERYGLVGLVPEAVETIERQVASRIVNAVRGGSTAPSRLASA